MRKKILFTLLCLLAGTVVAQDVDFAPHPHKAYHRGDLYGYWGWNWDAYTRSDIHFSGKDYDFTLEKVQAKDRQSPFSFKNYLSPVNLTIPQCNARVGYFLTDRLDLSIGWDHMKYVAVQGQSVAITGTIDSSGTRYDGVYDHAPVTIRPGFLEYEHTDGLNVANIELRRIEPLLSRKRMSVHVTEGLGLGLLFPRTDAHLLLMPRRDEVHFAGFELGGIAGINATFFQHVFIQAELKAGWIDMPYIRTTPSKTDRASQNFVYGQANVVIGAKWNVLGE